MIDYQQVEDLIKETKMSSITDVIHFVMQNIIKVLNFQPIEELSARISQLQKPQGLDTVMLQQVKALVQAMIEQKQDYYEQSMKSYLNDRIQSVIEQQNYRRGVKQIDALKQINEQNRNRKYLQQFDMKSGNLVNSQANIDMIKKQILQLRNLIQKKCQKRQISELKIEIHKQFSHKMTIAQTEKMIEKFQRQIFNKISQTQLSLQKMDFEVKKSLLNQVVLIKQEMLQHMKLNQIRQKVNKLDKKLKKMNSQASCSIKVYEKQIEMTRKQSKQSIDQICNLIQNIDNKLKVNSDSLKLVSGKLNTIDRNLFYSASWSACNNLSVKNMSICWQKQFANENQEVYKFQYGKSQILVLRPGLYLIQAYVSGCRKAPQLFYNSESSIKLLNSTNSKSYYFFASQIVKFDEELNKIWVKLDNQSQYIESYIKITKIA